MFQYTFSSNTKNPVNSRVGRAFDQRLSSERRLSRPAGSHFSSARRPVLLGYWIGNYHSLSRPEIQATFRGEKRVVKAGETINIPANAPHQFHNSSSALARMLCICSPAGQEEFVQRSRHTIYKSHDAASRAERRATGSIREKGAGACTEVSNRAAQRGISKALLTVVR